MKQITAKFFHHFHEALFRQRHSSILREGEYHETQH
jgi:hypothetical protein